ncbi:MULTISPECIES: hypothetical protein [Streptomyces]|uniref:hypothetical protein n=1 Tax=Streptomyces TaxID=1883 RepID=UPI0006EB4DA0|nr:MULTISPECIES: hypothetical protein [Streptomyces]
MSPATDEPAVVSYGTRASTTRVVRRGPHDFQWRRIPGETTVKATDLPPPPVLRLFADLSAESTVRFAVPRETGQRDLVYEVPDSVSIGWHMLAGAAVPKQYADVARRVGAAVRALHERPVPAGLHRTAAWLGGLTDWLGRRPDALSDRLARRVGAHRWAHLVRWAEEAAAGAHGIALGTLSPGVVVVDPRDLTAHVLISAEVGRGGPELDVGALAEALSTSVAVARSSAHHGPENLDYASLWEAFVSGYGPTLPDRGPVGRAALLRRVHRLRSMSSHIGENVFLHEQIGLLPDLVEQEGAPLVPTSLIPTRRD